MQDETVDLYEPAELELIAETLDGFVKVDSDLATAGITALEQVDAPTRQILTHLAERAREQARALLARAVEDPDLDEAVNAAGERVSARYGRAAVLRLSATHRMVCGLTDDVEIAWVSVRRVSATCVVVQPAEDEEIDAAQDRLNALAEAAG